VKDDGFRCALPILRDDARPDDPEADIACRAFRRVGAARGDAVAIAIGVVTEKRAAAQRAARGRPAVQ
jgi:hypothetical protein